ncbi:MAG: Zn-dependent exopeptidase M28 [Clostridia bacterium]|nr:Zn-dependent exopeptidase M28 [Clostridia bacterium]
MKKIFRDTAFVRTGGSAEELRAAEYLRSACASFGGEAQLEAFEVDMATVEHAVLLADGKEIPCKGYFVAGSGEVEAPLYYLTESDKHSLSQCRGKIVLLDGYLGFARYRDLVDNGAVGFITYDGNVIWNHRDIDQRELRSYIANGDKMPGVNINVNDAVAMVRDGVKTVRIELRQNEYKGNSHNVILDLPGTVDEYIVLSAHYDSTSLSQGAYDNMSGCVGLLEIAEYFSSHPHKRGLRFVWCGSEERGLLGAKAYCNAHEEDLKKAVLNVNLDMIGCIMGKFIACCTAENRLVDYISYMGDEYGFQIKSYQDIYSSDSTPFADHGVPAVSFARVSPREAATIHNRYDTMASMSMAQMKKDSEFVIAFVSRMANAAFCPVSHEIPADIKEKLDKYLCRKR